jgi:hypothetical protein
MGDKYTKTLATHAGKIHTKTLATHAGKINVLSGETLAIQAVISHVFGHMAVVDPRIADAIRTAFDDAASFVEDTAIKLSKKAAPGHAVKAILVVEQLRTATLADQDKPKHVA